jgi:hypothetical protein
MTGFNSFPSFKATLIYVEEKLSLLYSHLNNNCNGTICVPWVFFESRMAIIFSTECFNSNNLLK